MRQLFSVLGSIFIAFSSFAYADEYPNQAVKIVVGTSAGSGPDIQSRVVGNQLGTILKHQFIVENKPGANQTLAARSVAQSDPDGYTLLFVSSSIAPTPFIYKNAGYDLLSDLKPVATIGILDGMFMIVDAKSPFKNVSEFVDYAKKNRTLYGSPGVGNILHLATEMFSKKAGISMQHVPYKGAADVMTALLGGSLQVMFVTPPSVVGLIESGRVRALTYTGTEPFPAFPKVPLMKNILPGSEPIGSWAAFFVPAKTPPDVVVRLNSAIREALNVPAVSSIMLRDGYVPDNRGPAETEAFVRREVAIMEEAVAAAGIKPF